MTDDVDVNAIKEAIDIVDSLSPIGAMAFAMGVLVKIAKLAEAAPKPVSGHSVIDGIAATAHAKLKADG